MKFTPAKPKPPAIAPSAAPIPSSVEVRPFTQCVYLNGRHRSRTSPGMRPLQRRFAATFHSIIQETEKNTLRTIYRACPDLTIETIVMMTHALGYTASFGMKPKK